MIEIERSAENNHAEDGCGDENRKNGIKGIYVRAISGVEQIKADVKDE